MGSQPIANLENLKEHLTYDKLAALRIFWFGHLPQGASRIIVAPEHHNRWFFPDKEFDDACVTQFSPILEAIRNSRVTSAQEICTQFSPILEAIRNSRVTSAQEILSVAQPRNPLDWLSLVILLDQITRNAYRGDKAPICFTYFDPLALQLSLEAIKRGIPDQAPEIRWVFSHRNWFYMPLMHSEDLSIHSKAGLEFDRVNQDIVNLMEGTGGADEYEKRAREVVQADPEAAKKMEEINRAFEEKHLMIIKKFGRYPHRNQALGREPTPEETAFLENGGDTFGS